MLYSVLWYPLSFMLHLLTELIQWLRWGLMLADASSKFVRKMFYGFQIRWLWGPWQYMNVVQNEEIQWYTCCMGRALSCWNISQCRSIALVICGCKISSITARIITLPPLTISASCTQTGTKHLFRSLDTRIFPSHLCRRKRGSSRNQIWRQFHKVQTINVWQQRTRVRLCTSRNTGPI